MLHIQFWHNTAWSVKFCSWHLNFELAISRYWRTFQNFVLHYRGIPGLRSINHALQHDKWSSFKGGLTWCECNFSRWRDKAPLLGKENSIQEGTSARGSKTHLLARLLLWFDWKTWWNFQVKVAWSLSELSCTRCIVQR